MTLPRLFPLVALAAIAIAPACNRNNSRPATVQTAPVVRRDIVVDAQASGVVEPINIVEVKSKASGMITRMNVETGSLVRPGELLAQIDTRDVRNQYDQAEADEQAAQARLEVSIAQKRRSDEMFGARVITAQEHETAALDFANSQAALIRAKANLDLAKQRLEDATVSAPVAGTIIERTVSEGMVITSATGGVSGGTTLLKMADLTRVRMRAQFNETDIGQVRSGQPAIVIVDAYPDRRFNGVVEKIEPQAVVNQGVTMFPVLVTLSNADGALKPGMNGEVQVQIDQRLNVLAVPNDAIRNTREAMATAPLLGLNPDSVQAQMRAQSGAGRGGMRGGQPTGARQQGRVTSSPGEVALDPTQQRQFQSPQVTDAECTAVQTALKKKPAEAKKLDALRDRMRAADADRNAMREESQTIYAALGVDARIANACRMREMRPAGNAAPSGGSPAATPANAGGAQRQTAPATVGQPELQLGNTERGGGGERVRAALVFVVKGTTFEPRMVMLGAGNFDYTEVVSGLQEGEEVALLAALSLQALREQSADRIRQNMGGGVPGMSQGATPGGGRR
ncbi:MAG: efflux RND transporter periplasmic adaptor subunit [Gemmatimonadaceae bacterium]